MTNYSLFIIQYYFTCVFYMSVPIIANFTIYGERSSGTFFLEEAITKNFNLPVMWYYDWKHFFGAYDFDTDNANVPAEGNAIDNTIFIGIVREPVSWLNSFSKNLQYVPACNHELTNFLNNPFYSVAGEGDQEEVIQEDVNYITKERFKNIFELRKIKNDFLINVVRTKVKNYVLIRYEDLLNNYVNTLDQIKNAFNLVKAHDEYEKIVNHTNGSGLFTGERTIDFSCATIDDIWSKLDIAQEQMLGYDYHNALHVDTPIAEPLVLQEVVEPVLQEVVEPVLQEAVEQAVEPVLQEALQEAVEPALQEALQEVLEPVLKEVVEPVLKEVVEPVLQEVVEPVLKEVVEPVLQEVVEPVLQEVVEPVLQEVIKNAVVRTIPSMRLEGIISPKTAPIVKRNYSPVARFVNNQIQHEVKRVKNDIITNVMSVIPKFVTMFRAIILPKLTETGVKVQQVKYKKGSFFEMAR
jgi:hypothetical protein